MGVVVGGTSPRTRGKPPVAGAPGHKRRNIPAHAGKTPGPPTMRRHHQEHPRARGENFLPLFRRFLPHGTSPRTRGKLGLPRRLISTTRNIPAHAGKTGCRGAGSRNIAEHPRARGENPVAYAMSISDTGTSPRTRGKLVRINQPGSNSRNIPAHAGKT